MESENLCKKNTTGAQVSAVNLFNKDNTQPISPAWTAVFSLTMGVFGLLTAEYLPASLLTPMASELGLSEAVAGQTVTVTAIAALFSGLLLPGLTRSLDKRIVLLSFSALMIVSNLFVACSSSIMVLLLMRTLLGIALGGFWAMAAAVAMRLVPLKLVPRALSIIFSGIAVGTVVSVPLGSYLGGLFGWRRVVATVQGAIAAGAAMGGLLFNYAGISGVFVTAGISMLLAGVFIALLVRVKAIRKEAGRAVVSHH